MKQLVRQITKYWYPNHVPIDNKQAHAQEAHERSYWLKKNAYYYDQIARYYAFMIPKNMRVLHINCGTGYLLKALEPHVGVGVGADKKAVLAEDYNDTIRLHTGLLADISPNIFDYVIISCVTENTDDIQGLLEQLHQFCTPHTRIFVETYSYVWEPLLWLASAVGLRRPTPFKHWISSADLANFFHLAGFDVVTSGAHTMLPFYVPLLSFLANNVLARLPLIDKLCLHRWALVRPLSCAHQQIEQPTVSVVVPCRNERGNVCPAIERLPAMGRATEIIFVEGGSSDGTLEEIKQAVTEYPEKNIQFFVQDGIGKGDAVRKGFAKATGDIVMILDADLTVPPEDMSRFVAALVSGKGEFINGSRLVYGMESDAMRPLNLLVNFCFGRLFSCFLGQRVKDTLCGTKVLWRKDYEKIVEQRAFFGKQDPFGDFDLIFGAAKLNLKIVDMPVAYKRRTYGTTNISTIACFKHGIHLLHMSLRALKKLRLRW